MNGNPDMVVDVIDSIGAETLSVPNGTIVSKTWPRLNINIVRASEVADDIKEFLEIFGITDVEKGILQP